MEGAAYQPQAASHPGQATARAGTYWTKGTDDGRRVKVKLGEYGADGFPLKKVEPPEPFAPIFFIP